MRGRASPGGHGPSTRLRAGGGRSLSPGCRSGTCGIILFGLRARPTLDCGSLSAAFFQGGTRSSALHVSGLLSSISQPDNSTTLPLLPQCGRRLPASFKHFTATPPPAAGGTNLRETCGRYWGPFQGREAPVNRPKPSRRSGFTTDVLRVQPGVPARQRRRERTQRKLLGRASRRADLFPPNISALGSRLNLRGTGLPNIRLKIGRISAFMRSHAPCESSPTRRRYLSRR
jgi:hypothetical protein